LKQRKWRWSEFPASRPAEERGARIETNLIEAQEPRCNVAPQKNAGRGLKPAMIVSPVGSGASPRRRTRGAD